MIILTKRKLIAHQGSLRISSCAHLIESPLISITFHTFSILYTQEITQVFQLSSPRRQQPRAPLYFLDDTPELVNSTGGIW